MNSHCSKSGARNGTRSLACVSVLYSKRKTTTLMYKIIICFFTFPFITRVREGVGDDRDAQRERERDKEREGAVRFFGETSLPFSFVLNFIETSRAQPEGFESYQFLQHFATFVSLELFPAFLRLLTLSSLERVNSLERRDL